MILILALILGVVVYFKFIRQTPADYELISEFYGEKCWCKEAVVDESIRPFKINISDGQLADLKTRIDLVRYPTPTLEDSKFNYGMNQNYFREFVEYWRDSYSWKEQEEKINKFDHFITKIEGLDIHFFHIKPKATSPDNQPRPLLLCHGWPGSFYEFMKIIPMLTDPTSHGGHETDLFEVIIPSIPGYGFSQAPEKMGFNFAHCARIFHKLMQRIGHKKYYVQGGDWGSAICTNMAMLYPSSVRGVHINMANGSTPPLEICRMLIGSFAPKWFFNAKDANKLFPLKNTFLMFLEEMGYMHIQATKPDTIGFSLSDSPVGLAAYILEKFSTWTDMDGRNKNDGGIPKYWTKDELLTNIMIYWWTNSITSSMRFYKEAFSGSKLRSTMSVKVRVPAGYAWFPNELFGVTKKSLYGKFTRLVSFTYMKEGGHFAAFQVPRLLADDFRQFVRKVENVKEKQAVNEMENAQFQQSHLDRFEKE